MIGAECMELVGPFRVFSVELVKKKAPSASCLPGVGTALAARVWPIEWRKRTRDVNIGYTNNCLIPLSEGPQNTDPLLLSFENQP